MFFREKFTLKNTIFTILILFLLWFIFQIKEIALLFFGAYVIACSLNPAVDKLSKYMNRALASTIILLGALLLIIIVLVPIFVISYKEIIILLNDLPARLNDLIQMLGKTKIMGHTIIDLINVKDVLNQTSQFAGSIVNKSIDITVALVEAITVALSVGMIVFYLTYEKTQMTNSTLRLFPPKIRLRAAEIMTVIENKVGGYIIAQGLSMSTVALFTAIGLAILQIKYAVLLGLIAGILDIIPIVGPTIALSLGVIVAFSTHGFVWALLTVLIYLIAQWVSNNFVRPLVFGKFLNLHPVLVIFAFLVAAKFLGVWGVILAPAIAALVTTLFDELYVKIINKEKDERL